MVDTFVMFCRHCQNYKIIYIIHKNTFALNFFDIKAKHQKNAEHYLYFFVTKTLTLHFSLIFWAPFSSQNVRKGCFLFYRFCRLFYTKFLQGEGIDIDPKNRIKKRTGKNVNKNNPQTYPTVLA